MRSGTAASSSKPCLGDAFTIARDLLDEVTEENRATWRASTPTDWANESFSISLSPELQYCVLTNAGCWYDSHNKRLDEGEPDCVLTNAGCWYDSHNKRLDEGEPERTVVVDDT